MLVPVLTVLPVQANPPEGPGKLEWSVHLFVPRWEKMNTPKRMSRTLKAIRQQLRRRMHTDAVETGRWLGMVLKGWYNYFAVPTSYPYLKRFEQRLKREWMTTLRRRSQKDRFPWERLDVLCESLWPELRVLHDCPDR